MINRTTYDILILIILLLIILLIWICKKKEHFTSAPEPNPSPSEYIPQLNPGEYPNVIQDLKDNYLDTYQEDMCLQGNYDNKTCVNNYQDAYIEGTYKRLPFKKGTRLLYNDLDEGVLKNFRVNEYVNTHSIELDYDKMRDLLNHIENQKNFKLDIDSTKIVVDNKLNKSYIQDKIFKKLVQQINNYYKKLQLDTMFNYQDTRKYQIKETKVIRDEEPVNYTPDNRMLVFNISIYKELKNYFFTFQVSCLYNINQLVFSVEEINIIGIQEAEKLVFNKTYPVKQEHCILDKPDSFNSQLTYCHPNKLKKNDRGLALFEQEFNKNELQKFYQDKKDEELRDREFKKHKCFLKKGFNESTCKSYSFEKKTFGVWDKPCNKNIECPFYRANKNYDNKRGGCINGYCEMPKNVKRIGHKYFDPKQKPFCHNCERENCVGEECFTCCQEQHKKENKYQNLKSADYIFDKDNR